MRKNLSFLIIVLGLFCFSVLGCGGGPSGVSKANATGGTERFSNQMTGFSFEKPSGWVYLSAETISENRANIRLKDKELENYIRERANVPLVVVAKYQEPYETLNPSAQVMFQPLGAAKGISAIDLLKGTVKVLEGSFADFTLVDGIKEVKVSGLTGAYVKAKYTVANAEGREFKTISSTWLIPRGDFLFIISMSAPPEGEDFSEKEFKEIFSSIKIEK
ncbi:MAG: hypothetical protein KAT46_01785 [Deltaproteobacteria bacterium]|nr:hypothetical protein [Deltaproteobacteria bacterium]